MSDESKSSNYPSSGLYSSTTGSEDSYSVSSWGDELDEAEARAILKIISAEFTKETFDELSDQTIFDFFILIAKSLHRMGAMGARAQFVDCFTEFLKRINVSRALKTRFLLLLLNEEVSSYWKVNLILQRDCYKKASKALEDESIQESGINGYDEESISWGTFGHVSNPNLETKQSEDKATKPGNKKKNGKKSSEQALKKIKDSPKDIQALTKSDDSILAKSSDESTDDTPKTKISESFRKQKRRRKLKKSKKKEKVQQKPRTRPQKPSDIVTEDDVYFFARYMMFNNKCPEAFTEVKDRKHRMHIHKNSFFANEAVDWLMKHLVIESREEAVILGERLRNADIIYNPHNRNTPFIDKRVYFTLNLATEEDAIATYKTVLYACDGTQICPRTYRAGSCTSGAPNTEISGIQITLPVDFIDMQTRQFFGWSINNTALVAGANLGFQIIAHPLRVENETDDQIYVNEVHVEKIFSSIAAPVMVSFNQTQDGTSVSTNVEMDPRIIFKKGDNLFQDMGVEIMFNVMNIIWNDNADAFGGKDDTPWIYTYDVQPTGEKRGYLECVPGLESFKDFNWHKWAVKYEKNPAVIKNMLNSAAGAFIGAYVVGVRDRHWDNIQVKDERTLFHIDFGFVLGAQPPIDAPTFSISKGMMSALASLGCWNKFIDQCVKAFTILRRNVHYVRNTAQLVFHMAGFTADQVANFIDSDRCFMLTQGEPRAVEVLRGMLSNSAKSWQNLFKQFSHKNIDPVWYGLLKHHFPPAALAMKVVEKKEVKRQKEVKKMRSQDSGEVVQIDNPHHSF